MTEPVSVIYDNCFSFTEVKKAGHLFFDAFHILINCFDGQHFPHVGFAGGITDHRGSSAHQRNRLMAGFLHMGHRHNRNVMSDVQTVGSRIKSDIKSGRGF